MNVVSRECNHTSVSGDTTEERESEREWINERDYVSMSEYSNEWLVRIVLYIQNIYINTPPQLASALRTIPRVAASSL